jgi:hypothetical protein
MGRCQGCLNAMRALTWAALAGMVSILAGCSTSRTGYISMPYVGEVAPNPVAPGRGPAGWDHLRYLSIQGVDMYINLMNDVDTTKAPWTGMGERRVVQTRHCILLRLLPAIDGLSLEPKLVSMSVNGIPHAPGTAQQSFGGRLGSRTADVTEATVPLVQGQWNHFQLCFDEAAAPDQNITLDVSRALRHPDNPQFPLIKFKLQPYSHSYS